jgi:hypothetical protein
MEEEEALAFDPYAPLDYADTKGLPVKALQARMGAIHQHLSLPGMSQLDVGAAVMLHHPCDGV